MNENFLTAKQLKKAISLAEKIDSLESKLSEILGSSSPAASTPASATAGAKRKPTGGKRGRAPMSAEGRARIVAAQKARWAKKRAEMATATGGLASGKSGADAKPAPKRGGKRNLTPEGRARLAANMKARWAKKKALEAKPAASKASAKAAPAPKARKKGGLTPEGRAKLAASMKARWEKAKKSGAASPNSKKKGRK